MTRINPAHLLDLFAKLNLVLIDINEDKELTDRNPITCESPGLLVSSCADEQEDPRRRVVSVTRPRRRVIKTVKCASCSHQREGGRRSLPPGGLFHDKN